MKGCGSALGFMRPSWATFKRLGDSESFEVEAMQLEETRRIVLLTAMPQVAVAFALRFVLPGTGSRAALTLLLVAVAVPATIAVLSAHSWRITSSPRSVATGHAVATVLAFASGSAWSILPITFLTVPGGPHVPIVVATIAGLISIVYVIGPIMAASMSFLLPIVVAAFASVGYGGDPDCFTIRVLLLIYAAFTVVCRMFMNGIARERFDARIELRGTNDTIALLLRDFEENAKDWLWRTDRDGRLSYVPPRMLEVSGLRREQALGASLTELLAPAIDPGGDEKGVVEALVAGRPFVDRVVEVLLPNGAGWWKLTGRPIHGPDGSLNGFHGVATDVTEARADARRMTDLAERDHLTKLANRATFSRLVDEAISQRPLSDGSILYLDVDDFKSVNDDGGHAAGDAVLKQAADRISKRVPRGAVVSRLSGDEFAVFLETDSAAAVLCAKSLVEAFETPFQAFGHSFVVGLSIGVATRPLHASDREELLGKADMALYAAKADGKNSCRLFDPAIEEAVLARRAMEADLASALQRDEFELNYQPIVSCADGRIVAFEALLRWHSPTRGRVLPGDFVQVAEQCGLIEPLGKWILAEACRQAARWPKDVRVAVNVSPRQLRAVDFGSDVYGALRDSGLPAHRLEIEITEGMLLEDGAAPETLRELRSAGIKVAIDDFGTGFSSLSYVCRFAVDRIKIDRSFVADAHRRDASRAVVEAIVALARSLAVQTTAEGVETETQAAFLRHAGCDDLQGYLFSRPVPAREVPALLERVRRANVDPARRLGPAVPECLRTRAGN